MKQAKHKCSFDGCQNVSMGRGKLCHKHYYGQRKSAPCSIEGCQNPSYATGKCKHHYEAHRIAILARPCATPLCDRPMKFAKQGLCATCYNRKRRKGEIDNGQKCCVEGCDRFSDARGYCGMHYGRLTRHGDPLKRLCNANGEGSTYSGYLIFGSGKGGGAGKRKHRLVMEDHLGRSLTPDEVVHHKDGNKLNNAISNLCLTNRPEHALLCGLENVFRLPKEEARRLLDLLTLDYRVILE